jgi:DNA-binding protein Fis
MKSGKTETNLSSAGSESSCENQGSGVGWKSSIGDSLDSLVEYLVDNNIEGIHPLIMGEVEKRLIIKVLERSRGNKLRAARSLGLSRNTFHRKVCKLKESCDFIGSDSDS